jgi:SPX domain protein involved in polyphosphate accumulation|tara:strand:- start:69 stop:689 length:621 start_codon:yes stop_codon:yes gene_type:complete
MSFRIEEKLKVAESKLFQLRDWITKNMGITMYPSRTINSIYFDNQNYTMYNQSIEGVLPRKKIRLRVYDKEFSPNKRISKEIKISSVEGKYKISKLEQNPLKLLNFGIYDNNYGLCLPVLNVLYKRSYYKIKNIRLTIDEKIIYRKIINRKISEPSTFDRYNIVELKCNSKKSISLLSNNFPFERTRFSKYSRGIEFTRLNYCNEL